MLKGVKILIFDLNGEDYAIDIQNIERILGYEEPTKLPENADFVRGVINYENSILPVLSLSKRFGFEGDVENEQQKIIVVKKEDKKFGVIVDNVHEVRDIKAEDLEDSVLESSMVTRRYIKGMIRLDRKIVIVLDVGSILSEDEEQKLF